MGTVATNGAAVWVAEGWERHCRSGTGRRDGSEGGTKAKLWKPRESTPGFRRETLLLLTL